MRTLPIFLGLISLVAAQAAQASSYVFSTTVNGSTSNVATLSITQQGADTLFQLAPTAAFSSLGSAASITTFSLGYDTAQKVKSAFTFPTPLPASNVQPGRYKFSSSFHKSTQDYVNTWNLNWGKGSFGSTQTSTWIATNSTASLFGSSFYMKIQDVTGVTKTLKLTTLNAAPVPEVSNLSMYITGLGLVGLVMLRRRGGPGATRH